MINLALLLPLLAQDVQVSYTAPSMFIQGEPFTVTVTAEAPYDGPAALPAWGLSPAAFELDGKSLGDREMAGFVSLVAGQKLSTTFDLSPALSGSEHLQRRNFQLGCAGTGAEPREVTFLESAPRGIDFMTLPAEQLGDYNVVMLTIAGPLWMEFWPEVAPEHVRNFLDLSYTGFYDGSHFHRVIPGFMIQGGGARPDHKAPRRLKNEFNERRHLPGVLSMARMGADTKDENGQTIPAFDSATSEFFVMHAVYPSLDGKYTGFGKLVQGLDVVETIVNTGNKDFNRRDPRASTPTSRQSIYKAIVVKAPSR
jgi:peptidyl-prolyl cis-trans isomerase B (cyclophilin B)